MSTFFASLAAYIVGWVLCNVVVAYLARRDLDNDKRMVQMSRLVAAEFYRIVHPEPTLPIDDVGKESSKTETP